jgi:hypothetical protein
MQHHIVHKLLPSSLQPQTAYEFVVSSELPDLVGDIVVQKGIRPVSPRIPAMVDHTGSIDSLVGHWQDITNIGNHTTAKLVLFEKGLSRSADLIRGLLDTGVRMAASVGLRGVQIEKRQAPSRGVIYKLSDLVEISVVATPCHPDALSVVKSMGFTDQELQRFSAPSVEDDMKRFDALARSAAAISRASNSLLPRSK